MRGEGLSRRELTARFQASHAWIWWVLTEGHSFTELRAPLAAGRQATERSCCPKRSGTVLGNKSSFWDAWLGRLVKEPRTGASPTQAKSKQRLRSQHPSVLYAFPPPPRQIFKTPFLAHTTSAGSSAPASSVLLHFIFLFLKSWNNKHHGPEKQEELKSGNRPPGCVCEMGYPGNHCKIVRMNLVGTS